MATKDVTLIKQDLLEIVNIMKQTHGRDISVYEESFLAKTIDSRLTETSINTGSEYQGYLSENPKEAELLARSLNITHSEFFRNWLSYALLEQLVLPSILEEKVKSGSSEIRIWSAACAAGQEAYSISILLTEINDARQIKVPSRIFATDISDDGLAMARKGMYALEAVKNVRLKHIKNYFTSKGNTYTIDPSLQTRISFSYYDLLDKHSICPFESIYGDFDLILCSNLLFYYKPGIQQFIINKLYRSLADGGYLFTDEAEKFSVRKYKGFRAVAPPAAVFKKSSQGK